MSTGNNMVSEDKRTTMNVSLSVEDKKFLKIYAAEHDTSVSALIHEAVERLRQEERENGRK